VLGIESEEDFKFKIITKTKTYHLESFGLIDKNNWIGYFQQFIKK
jgi:hypothetical protein